MYFSVGRRISLYLTLCSDLTYAYYKLHSKLRIAVSIKSQLSEKEKPGRMACIIHLLSPLSMPAIGFLLGLGHPAAMVGCTWGSSVSQTSIL